MAVSEAARLLDELMGRYRNLNPDEIDRKIAWDDADVCRYFLVKFCPNELFTNTKSDLGVCDRVHDEELRKEFAKSTTGRKYAYEDDFLRYAESMINEVDRKIEKGKQRLALSLQESMAKTTGDGHIDEQVELLSERITGMVAEAERLGSEGNVEEAQGLSRLCDKLREERDALRRNSEHTIWNQAAEMAVSQEKQMEVCEICGAFLIVGDAQQRIDDHLQGKQHVGYARLRTAVIELHQKREEEDKQRDKEREERRKHLEERREKEEVNDRRDDRNDRRDYRGDRRDDRRRDDYRRDYDRNRDRRPYSARDDRGHHRSSRGDDRDHRRSRDGDRNRNRSRDRSRDRSRSYRKDDSRY